MSYAQEHLDYLIQKDATRHEELAIMTNVRMGVDDRDRVSLMFNVTNIDGYMSSQWVPEQQALDLIKDSGVSNINHLEGKPCIVTKDATSMFYNRMFNPK